jgi:hypothetical protein
MPEKAKGTTDGSAPKANTSPDMREARTEDERSLETMPNSKAVMVAPACKARNDSFHVMYK